MSLLAWLAVISLGLLAVGALVGFGYVTAAIIAGRRIEELEREVSTFRGRVSTGGDQPWET